MQAAALPWVTQYSTNSQDRSCGGVFTSVSDTSLTTAPQVVATRSPPHSLTRYTYTNERDNDIVSQTWSWPSIYLYTIRTKKIYLSCQSNYTYNYQKCSEFYPCPTLPTMANVKHILILVKCNCSCSFINNKMSSHKSTANVKSKCKKMHQYLHIAVYILVL